MLVKMEASGGSGGSQIIEGTASGGTWSASWGYDAEALVVFNQTSSNVNNVLLIDIATRNYWIANSSSGWAYAGTLSSEWTVSPTSVAITASLTHFEVIALTDSSYLLAT